MKQRGDFYIMVTTNQTNTTIHPEYGLNTEDLQGTVSLLGRYLADQHILYMKTRKYHWNVQGRRFLSLHELFEEQYTAMADAIDETAERIRQYGATAPGTLAEMLELANISETPGEDPSARGMVSQLLADHETVVRTLRDYAEQAAEDYEDVATEDYFVAMIQDHQGTAWMLRAHLEGADSL